MKKIFTLIIFFTSFNSFSQNDIHMLSSVILNEYLFKRIGSENCFVQKETINNIIFDHEIFYDNPDIEKLKEDKNFNKLFNVLNLPEKFKLRKRDSNYHLIKKIKLDKYFNRVLVKQGLNYSDPLDNWKLFKEVYPECEGIIKISEVIFSDDQIKSAIYIEFDNGTDRGFGDLLIACKHNNKWEIVKSIHLTKPLIEVTFVK